MIRLLALQVLQQRDRRQARLGCKQRQQHLLPDSLQRIGAGAASRLTGLGLDPSGIDAAGTAHGEARRRGSRLLGAADASLFHVQLDLLARQRCRHHQGHAHRPQGQQPRSQPANELVANRST